MGKSRVNEITFLQGTKRAIIEYMEKVHNEEVDKDDIRIIFFQPLKYPHYYMAMLGIKKCKFIRLFQSFWSYNNFAITELSIVDTVDISKKNKHIFSEETISLYGMEKIDVSATVNVFKSDFGHMNPIITDITDLNEFIEEFEK